MSERRVYLDHAALAPIDKRVVLAMEPFLQGNYGNPSSIYEMGRKTKQVIAECKVVICEILHCQPEEIIFTSGGTESDNLAILGAARANKDNGKHIITTQFEHHAVLHACSQLEKEGFEVTYLPVNQEGFIDVYDLKEAIRKDTILISVMYANNEIGTIQPVREIGEILKRVQDETGRKAYFHTDACQAGGYLNLDTNYLNVDLMSLNGTKIYGPTGAGILFAKKDVDLEPIIYGGGQQNALRSGTENILGIIGFTEALKIADAEKHQESERLMKLRDYLVKGVLELIDEVKINGLMDNRLPNNANISFEGIEGESVVLMLDEEGIAVSTGSACNSDSLKPSHVLTAIGLSDELAHGSIRFSSGRETTKEDVDYVLQVLPGIVKRLRSFSPLRSKNG